MLVLVGDLGVGQRDRPRRSAIVGIAQVERGVGGAGAPVLVDEVGVGRAVLERLVGVADAAGHEDRGARVQLGVERRRRRSRPRACRPRRAKTRPVATETNLSHGSVWMPRVAPRRALKDMLFCTGPKSGRPSAVIFSRCQFSLNQPRESSCTAGGPRADRGSGSARRGAPPSRSLALRGVGGLGGVLGRAPPVLVRDVPLDGAAPGPPRSRRSEGFQPSSVRSLVESIA